MSMQKQNLLVTGVSGHYGRLAATHLIASHPAGSNGATLIGTTRTPSHVRDLADRGVDVRQADFDQPSGLAGAFAGAQRMLLTSTAADCAGARRVRQHRHAIAAAQAAGVGHVVYASFLASADSPLAALAADHLATEQALHAARIGHTVLRHAFYMEMVLATARQAIASGVLRTLNASAGVAYVARADCALAGACALRGGSGASPPGTTFDITGPHAVTPTALAGAIGDCLGIEVKVEEVSEDELRASLVAGGLPDPVAGLVVYLERGMAQGAMQAVSPDFGRLTGREPRGIESFLIQHREALTAVR